MKCSQTSAALLITAAILSGGFVHSPAAAAEPATASPSTADAVPIYDAAIAAARVDSPAATSAEFRAFPPYGDEWEKIAAVSFEQNHELLELMHKARQLDHAAWTGDKDKATKRWNGLRHVANIVGDAALLQHSRGDDRAAFETLRDLDHLVRLVRKDTRPDDHFRALIGIGLDVFVSYRTMTIAADLKLSDEKSDARQLTIRDLENFTGDLLAMPAAEPMADKLFLVGGGKAFIDGKATPEESRGRAIEQARRTDAERGLTAMSLACKVFQKEKGRWPATVEELATKLPKLPLDPWTAGKETLGYTLVKSGLPNGKDRPLVYSRCESKDGLAYRVDEPQFGFYTDDGSNRPRADQKRTGQFRDVTLWQPTPVPAGAPKTRPLD